MTRLIRSRFLLLGLLMAGMPVDAAAPLPPAAVPTPASFDAGTAGFAVKVRGVISPYQVLGVFVMPGERLAVEALGLTRPEAGRLDAAHGTIAAGTASTWRWTAPDAPGHYPLTLTDTATGEAITLNAFVLVPFDHRDDWLNGYRIGAYERVPLRGNPAYIAPRGFIEVTPANEAVRVAPHFTLGQFLCKQEGGYPKYLILREPLLLKLEMILEAVNRRGVAARTLHVMSAFRTPYYNRHIGNRTVYSRHLYGDAADIFVDADGDERMDDLNGDGQTTTADAEVLAALVDGKAHEPQYRPFIGGMGIYGPKRDRGPFVHIDVRGQRVRW